MISSVTIRGKLFWSHFLAVILVLGSVGTFFYLSAVDSLTKNLQARLQNSAALASQTLDAKQLTGIRTDADIGRPEYQEILQLLRSYRRTNKDIAFLYVMRRSGDRVFFVVDSDETPDQALPGREYTSVVPKLLAGFGGPSVDEKIETDEWGSFMSGYAPLRNGRGEYLVGLDMRADEVQSKLWRIRTTGAASLVFSILLAMLFSRILSGHFVLPIQALIGRCSAISRGLLDERVVLKAGGELEELVGAFNTMSSHLAVSRANNRQAEEALRMALDGLEQRVEERTRDLRGVNERLRHEVEERRKAEKALALAAAVDYLTGLLNRRAILEHMDYQVVRAQRTHEPFALLLCDLDGFKRVNDTYGHEVGDQVLRSVAERLKQSCRAQDLVSRWGGEEFLLFLPETDLQGALHAAEKLRARITDQLYPAREEGIRLTISVGIAVYGAGETLDDTINRADVALYQAKSLGRDRTECSA